MTSPTKTEFETQATAFELDGDLILFAAGSGDLFLLNPTAALVWHGLADGLSLDEIVDTLTSIASQPRSKVESDCAILIADWQKSGILAGNAPSPVRSSGERLEWWSDDGYTAEPLNFRPKVVRDYRLVDFRFRLRTGDAPVDRGVHELLSHLQAEENASSILDLVFGDDRWCLYHNGRLVDLCTDAEGVVPLVHGNLMVAAYRRSSCLVALHAAAVTVNGRCVLLAGVPGSGKSTLTAALLRNGFGYCADDTVLLTTPPIGIRGVPTRLGIKEGSWPALRELWPELDELPIYRRADGQQIRYLVAADAAKMDQVQNPRTADILVFPHYQAGCSTRMHRMRRADALMKLAESGYDVPDAINGDIVSDLIGWMTSLDCYELQYSDIREAVAKISAAIA